MGLAVLWLSVLGLYGFLARVTAEGDGYEAPSSLLDLAPPFVYEGHQRCGVDDGCLKLEFTESGAGEDGLGQYYSNEQGYVSPLGATVLLSTRQYGDGTRVYKQAFPLGLNGSSTGDKDLVSTGFPRVSVPRDAPGLHFFTPGGYMAGWTLMTKGSMASDAHKFRDGEDGGIVVLYEMNEDTIVSSLVMSALSQPMAVSVHYDRQQDTLDWGVEGLADHIPAGFECEVILHPHPTSVTRNILSWGDLLQKYHPIRKLDDATARYLSYYTDNGAFHYYNPLPFLNLQAALLHVHNYSLAHNIPFRSVQLDSWWYHKGEGQGVKNWTALDHVIPDGIAHIHQVTGWPIVAHNRYFSSDNDYAHQNGGPYRFTIDEETQKALPLDLVFWEDLLEEAVQWGLATYEQDWLDRQYMFTSALHTDVELGGRWLEQMGGAAAGVGVAVQYCMSLTRQLLHGASLPAVTQVRVSDDYMLNPNQWRIGASSLLVHALGMKPYKDVFWSSRNNENNYYLDCDLVRPEDAWHPWKLVHSYGGRVNHTASGKPCLAWEDFGWDDLYYGSGLMANLCRNPNNLHDGPFCFTKAGFDIPEEEWEWEYCGVPVCDVDCYIQRGLLYIGSHNVTQGGDPCVDWAGDHGIHGAVCRNPNNDMAPWCYTSQDHATWDFCDNKCPEAFEYNPWLQGAVATLSGGPVGVGDKAENLNVNLIMKSCNADGLLLHPSKPLTVTDIFFKYLKKGELWTGISFIKEYTFGIIFLSEIENDLLLSPFELNLEEAFLTDTVVWQNYPVDNLNHKSIIHTGESVELPACKGFMDFCLWYTTPILSTIKGDLMVFGEREKWVPMSSQRVVDIDIKFDQVLMWILGVDGEQVNFYFSLQGVDFVISCHFERNEMMIIDVLLQICY